MVRSEVVEGVWTRSAKGFSPRWWKTRGSLQGDGKVRGNLDLVVEAGRRMRGWLMAQQRVGTLSRKRAGDRQQ